MASCSPQKLLGIDLLTKFTITWIGRLAEAAAQGSNGSQQQFRNRSNNNKSWINRALYAVVLVTAQTTYADMSPWAASGHPPCEGRLEANAASKIRLDSKKGARPNSREQAFIRPRSSITHLA